jgi:peptidyl-tRNA hydrolase
MKADEAYKRAIETRAKNIEKQQSFLDRQIEHAMSEGRLEITHDQEIYEEVKTNLKERLFKITTQTGSSKEGYYIFNKISWKHFGK